MRLKRVHVKTILGVSAGITVIVLLGVWLSLSSAPVAATNSSQIFLPLLQNDATPTPSPTPSPTPGPILVSGYVKDGATGKGLPNAQVSLVRRMTYQSYPATTNDAGYYTVPLPPDIYDLSVQSYPSSPPYTYTQETIPWFDAELAKGSFSAPDILMSANTATLSGLVTDATTGQPLVNGAVTVEVGIGYGHAAPIFYTASPSQTDGSGHYSILLAPNGYSWAYAYRASCNSYQFSSGFSLSNGQTVTIDFSLPACS